MRLRVGIVGCGEVTQLLHLPSLAYLVELFEVTAACDVSRSVLEEVSADWRIPARHMDYRELVSRSDVDVVLVANPSAYHAEVALAALAAGKHVLIEKPMCMTLREADEIAEAQRRSGCIVQVGYMRRYAAAFVEASRRLPDLGPIRLARVRDIIGANELFTAQAAHIVRGRDVPESVLAAGAAKQDALLAEALGDAPEALRTAYGLMLGLSSHDLSLMREMLGMPKRVLYASARQNGMYLTAAFDYGDFVCHFETGIDDIPRFDAGITIFGRQQVLSVRYNTPYVRNLPITLHLTASRDGALVQEDVHPSWEDAFVAEWRQMHANVRDRLGPKTPPEDFRRDLELFGSMIEQMRRSEGAP